MKYVIGLWLIFLSCPLAFAKEVPRSLEIYGSRSMAMGGAHRGIGTSNDTIYLNPAGMSLLKRYAIEGHYAYLPNQSVSEFNISALDSQLNVVAAGLAYSYERVSSHIAQHRFYLALSYPITEYILLGYTNQYRKGNVTNAEGNWVNQAGYSCDIGLMLPLGDMFRLGVTYHNLIDTTKVHTEPSALAFGIGITTELITLGFDFKYPLTNPFKHRVALATGAEYLLLNYFPIRIGYSREPYLDAQDAIHTENILSGGIGWMIQGGGIDIAYRQSLTRKNLSTLLATLKLFL